VFNWMRGSRMRVASEVVLLGHYGEDVGVFEG
jgi:hypothetical protein